MALLFALLGVSCFTEGAVLPPPKSLVARSYDSSNLYANWPTYDELPLHPCFPTKAAWGVWVSAQISVTLFDTARAKTLCTGR